VAGITTSVGVGMGADVGSGRLQAANNNKIRTAFAAANTFFHLMVDFLFVRSWFGHDINSPLPDRCKETISQKSMAITHHIQNTPQSHPSVGECLSTPLGGGVLNIFSYLTGSL
jgi:hypothetical protein